MGGWAFCSKRNKEQNATLSPARARPECPESQRREPLTLQKIARNLSGATEPIRRPRLRSQSAEISQVYPNGPAARAGLRSGDVIVQVNGQKVEDAAELVALVQQGDETAETGGIRRDARQQAGQNSRDARESQSRIHCPIWPGSTRTGTIWTRSQSQFGPSGTGWPTAIWSGAGCSRTIWAGTVCRPVSAGTRPVARQRRRERERFPAPATEPAKPAD